MSVARSSLKGMATKHDTYGIEAGGVALRAAEQFADFDLARAQVTLEAGAFRGQRQHQLDDLVVLDEHGPVRPRRGGPGPAA